MNWTRDGRSVFRTELHLSAPINTRKPNLADAQFTLINCGNGMQSIECVFLLHCSKCLGSSSAAQPLIGLLAVENFEMHLSD